jgi:hypothetical protein
MDKRTIAPLIALLSCSIVGICADTVMSTWSISSRNMIVGLVSFVSLLYIGLDLVLAPETSLLYRLVRNNPFSAGDPLLGVRVMGVFAMLMSLVFGWVFIGNLLGLIK